MLEKLQKILSSCGVASRRASEELIIAGRVTVNGNKSALGDRADFNSDKIEVDGVEIGSKPDKLYIMLNKPRGYVTTTKDEKGRRTVTDLVGEHNVYPVGRLDMNSEGLLILTNDGEAANRLMHPSNEIEKEYLVWVTGQGDINSLSEPIVIDGYRISPPKVKLLRNDGQTMLLRITIHEGRNRQIRRMCEIADLKVVRLKRIAEGELVLGELEKGKWRFLAPDEIAYLKRL